MSIRINLEDVPNEILEVVKARILKNRKSRQAKREVKPKPALRPLPQIRKIGADSKKWRRPEYAVSKKSADGFILVPSGQYAGEKLEVIAGLDQDTVAFTRADLQVHAPLSFMPTKKFKITSNTSGLSGASTNLMLEPNASAGEYSFTINRGTAENPEIVPHTYKGDAYQSTLSHYSITEGPVTGYDGENDKYITAGNRIVPYDEAKFNWTADKTKQATYEFIVYLESGTRKGESRINNFPIPPGGPPEDSGSLDPLVYSRGYFNEMRIKIQQGAGLFDYLEFEIRNHSVEYPGSSQSLYNWFNINENYFVNVFDSHPSTGSVPPGRHHIAVVYDFEEGSSTQIVRRTYLDGELKKTFSGASNANRDYRGFTVSYVGYEAIFEENGSFKQDIYGRYYWDADSVVLTYSPNVPKIWLQSFRFTPQALYKENFTPPTTITDLA